MTQEYKLPPLPDMSTPALKAAFEEYARAAIEPYKADRQRSPVWDYCPECGSTEHTKHKGCGNFCDICGQEWHPDIDYTGVVKANLADRKRRGDAIGEIKLWCLHIQGPDDVHPAPGREYAQVAADLHNARFDKVSERTGVMCKAVVAPWPYCAESHAGGVGSFVEDWLMPQPAEPSRGEQRIEWLREVRECAEHVATSDYFGMDAAISKLMSVVERWPQPAEPLTQCGLCLNMRTLDPKERPAEPSGAPALHNADSGAQNGIQATQTAAPNRHPDVHDNNSVLVGFADDAQPAADSAIERALTELVDKIVPGLDTGDLVADAATASKALDRAQPAASAEPVAIRFIRKEYLQHQDEYGWTYEKAFDPEKIWGFEAKKDFVYQLLYAAPVAAQPDYKELFLQENRKRLELEACLHMSVPESESVAAQSSVPSLIDQIAQAWDGCQYEDVATTIDIGAAIRREAARVLAATPPADGPAQQDDPTPEEEEAWQRMESSRD